MKVLLVNGSPKAKGCTYTALKEIVDELEKNGVEAEIIHIGYKDIRGCTATLQSRLCKTRKVFRICEFSDATWPS